MPVADRLSLDLLSRAVEQTGATIAGVPLYERLAAFFGRTP